LPKRKEFFLLPKGEKGKSFFLLPKRLRVKKKSETKKSSVSDDLKSCSCSKRYNVFVQQKNKQFASWKPFFW
tara:strand:+ start:104 stop:319 length:216 start_codon:yes stop_codon:yes gene_type:complete